MELEPEQERLLIELVEEGRSVRRQDRGWVHVRTAGDSDVLKGGAGGGRRVNRSDFLTLQSAGFLHNVGGQRWDLLPKAQAFYDRHTGDDPARADAGTNQRSGSGRFTLERAAAWAQVFGLPLGVLALLAAIAGTLRMFGVI